MQSAKRDLPVIAFEAQGAWEAWLAANSKSSKGVWLKLAKKSSGIPSISKQEAIETALCHGWIDGQIDKFDGDYWLIRFTPRAPKSKWSAVNRANAIKLIEQGRMNASGLQEIERAKADGRWDAAYAPQSKASIPDDLQIALEANERAKKFFGQLDSANRYAILYRINDAKKAETRASRIEKYVSMLSRGETIHPPKTKG